MSSDNIILFLRSRLVEDGWNLDNKQSMQGKQNKQTNSCWKYLFGIAKSGVKSAGVEGA